jgi:hypothetical protein
MAQFVDDSKREVEGARAEAHDGDNLGGCVEGGPDPDLLPGLTDIGPEFIELNVSTPQVLEDACVEFVGLETGAGEPSGQGAFADAPGPFEDGDIDPFGQEGQGFGHASGVGLEAVRDGLAADGELVAAGLTAQVLDPLVLAVGAIEDQSMAGLVRDAIIGTGWVMASEAFGAAGLLSASPAPGGTPGRGQQAGVFYIIMALAGKLFRAAEGTIGPRLGLDKVGSFGVGLL